VAQWQALLLVVVIGGPVMSAILWIINQGGKTFYIKLWAFLFAFQLVMLFIYPTVLAPLFNKFTPLEDSSLKAKIEELAASVQFPLTKVFVIDGSTRSAHSNAYFYGFFGNKRIVLFDTLLKQMVDTEIVAVLGHELGHWKNWHVLQMFCANQVGAAAAQQWWEVMVDRRSA
jgi:STE24 endopeptidase